MLARPTHPWPPPSNVILIANKSHVFKHLVVMKEKITQLRANNNRYLIQVKKNSMGLNIQNHDEGNILQLA